VRRRAGGDAVRLHNRNRESSFRPLDKSDRRPRKPNPGGGFSRDRKARIVDMLRRLQQMDRQPWGIIVEEIDLIVREVDR